MVMHKSFDLKVKAVKDDYTFEGYASTFYGEPDRYGDIVEPGSFSKSIEAHQKAGKMPALLMHHDMHRPVGVYKSMVEDEHGLHVVGELTKGVRDAEEAYALLKAGALHSMSIGYIPKVEEYNHEEGINYIKEVDLWEVSLVTIPANSNAVITGVKSVENIKTVRDLEAFLRDADGASLSKRDAKTLIATVKESLREEIRTEILIENIRKEIENG